MAAEDRSHPWLLDALYPEERDDQPTSPPTTEGTSDQAVDAQTSSRSAQQEVAQYRAMLGEVRQGLVTFQPREELRETIREAARKEAEAIVSRMASEQGPRRASRPRHTSTSPSETSSSFWSRARSQGMLQLAAVLAVCIGAGLLVRAISGQQHDEAMQAKFAPAAVEQEVSWDGAGGEAEEVLAMAPNEEPVEAGEGLTREQSATKERDDFSDYDYQARAQDQDKKDELMGALQTEPPTTSTSSRRTRSTSSPTKMKSSGRSSSDMRWDDQESTGALEKAEVKKSSSATRDYDAERSKAMPQKKEIATKGSIDSVFGGQEDVVQQEAMEEEPAPIYSGKRDAMGNAMDDSLFDAPTQRPSSASAQPQRAEDNSAATAKPAVASKDDGKQASAAESKPEPSASVGGFGTSAPGDAADSGRGGGANNTTLDDVERAYKRNDYQETVDEADAYLARRIGTNQERARAMELKAQALTSLGRGTEARGIYESIRELYPDYYNKENLQQKKKRKAAPKQESIPSADESFNQSF